MWIGFGGRLFSIIWLVWVLKERNVYIEKDNFINMLIIYVKVRVLLNFVLFIIFFFIDGMVIYML